MARRDAFCELHNSVYLVYHEEHWEITLVLPVPFSGNNVWY